MSLPWHCRLCPTQPHREDPRQCSSARERARRRPALQGEEEAPGESAANTDRGHSLGPEPSDADVRRRVGAPAGVSSLPGPTRVQLFVGWRHLGSGPSVVRHHAPRAPWCPVQCERFSAILGPNFVTGRRLVARRVTRVLWMNSNQVSRAVGIPYRRWVLSSSSRR